MLLIAAAYTFRSENSSVLFSRDCITAWLLAVMKKAREGRLYAPRQADDSPESAVQKNAQRPEQQLWKPEPRASAHPVSEENIRDLVKKIREKIINS